MTTGREVLDRYERVGPRFDAVVRGVPADRWNAPAPCAGWTARDVVRHLTDWVPSLFVHAGVPGSAPIDDEDPVVAWSRLDGMLRSMLGDPEVADMEADFGPPGRLTVAAAIDMLVVGDVLVHTWDLARATGQDETVDEAMAVAMYDGMLPLDSMLRASGHFGPRVDVPADAGPVARLIGFTGRTP